MALSPLARAAARRRSAYRQWRRWSHPGHHAGSAWARLSLLLDEQISCRRRLLVPPDGLLEGKLAHHCAFLVRYLRTAREVTDRACRRGSTRPVDVATQSPISGRRIGRPASRSSSSAPGVLHRAGRPWPFNLGAGMIPARSTLMARDQPAPPRWTRRVDGGRHRLGTRCIQAAWSSTPPTELSGVT
jgi:hypothetical protein